MTAHGPVPPTGGGHHDDLPPPAVPEAGERNTPAIAAALVGVVAFATAITPALLVVGIGAGALALGLGIAGLARLPRVRSGRGAAIGGVVLGGVSLLVAAGWLLVLLTEPDFTEGFLDGFREALRDEGGVFTLVPGECFEEPPGGDEIVTVPRVPCRESHHYEVFATVDHPALPGAAFPGEEEILEFAYEVCEGSAFRDYVGRSARRSRYAVDVVYPDAGSWRLGERTIVCVLHDSEEWQKTGSAAGRDE